MTLLWLQRLTVWFSLVNLCLCFSARALTPDERNNVDIYRRANPAVVNITTVTLKQDFFFQVIPEKGVGSGAIIDSKGYIVTNNHVLGRAQKISVTLHDQTEFPARVVGRDPDTDLAVIKINPKGRRLASLRFDSSKLSVGQKVLAIGNPFGLGGSLSVGVISSLGRAIKSETGRTIKDVVQTDAAINPGNSGGPLLNSKGQVIGINAQIFSRSGANHGVGFAISGTTSKKIVDQLIRFGQVLRPWLGIQGVGFSAALLQKFGVPVSHGVMVTQVYRGGPAAKLRLKAADKEYMYGMRVIPAGGDVIYQIDNKKVETLSDIQDYVFEKKVGTRVTVHFVRGRKRLKEQVNLNYPPNARVGSF